MVFKAKEAGLMDEDENKSDNSDEEEENVPIGFQWRCRFELVSAGIVGQPSKYIYNIYIYIYTSLLWKYT